MYVVWPPSEFEGYRKLRDAVSTAAGKKALLSPSAETWTLTFNVNLNTYLLGANAIITGQSDATWRSLANLILRDGARNVSASACVSDSHPTCPLRVVRACVAAIIVSCPSLILSSGARAAALQAHVHPTTVPIR